MEVLDAGDVDLGVYEKTICEDDATEVTVTLDTEMSQELDGVLPGLNLKLEKE